MGLTKSDSEVAGGSGELGRPRAVARVSDGRPYERQRLPKFLRLYENAQRWTQNFFEDADSQRILGPLKFGKLSSGSHSPDGLGTHHI